MIRHLIGENRGGSSRPVGWGRRHDRMAYGHDGDNSRGKRCPADDSRRRPSCRHRRLHRRYSPRDRRSRNRQRRGNHIGEQRQHRPPERRRTGWWTASHGPMRRAIRTPHPASEPRARRAPSRFVAHPSPPGGGRGGRTGLRFAVANESGLQLQRPVARHATDQGARLELTVQF